MQGSQVADIQEKFLFSLSQLSRIYGPARETISKRLNQAGVKPAGEKGGHPVFHIREASRAIFEAEYGALSFDGVEDPEKLPPKDRLDYYRSQNEKSKYEREQGLLVPLDDVREEFANIIKIVVPSLDTLPDVLERKCQLPPEAIEQVEAVVGRIRDDIAKELEK